MKKLLIAALACVVCAAVACAALAIAFLGLPLAVRAGGNVPCAAQNGDANADGKIDLTDAVTILGHLFLGNPQQLPPLCEPQAPSAALPATGQTTCFDFVAGQGFVPVPCAGAPCPGQDGSYATGCPMEGRFVDNGDGTVTDNCTGLQWQKDTADVNGDGRLSPEWDGGDAVPWCDALAYCENLIFAGHDDWLLPNVRELQSIVDYGRFNPSIDPVFGALSSVYWSSTSYAGNPDVAWVVGFGNGFVYSSGVKGNDYYVRAVRSGP